MGQQQSGDQHGRWSLLSLLPIDPRKISLPEDIARVCLASFLANSKAIAVARERQEGRVAPVLVTLSMVCLVDDKYFPNMRSGSGELRVYWGLRANPKHQHSIRLNTKQLTELGGIAAKAILTEEWGWDLCNNLAIEASRLQKQNMAFGEEKAELMRS